MAAWPGIPASRPDPAPHRSFPQRRPRQKEQRRYNRPEDCRLYPALVTEMVADDCEMLEPNDLLNLELAQAVLDSKFR